MKITLMRVRINLVQAVRTLVKNSAYPLDIKGARNVVQNLPIDIEIGSDELDLFQKQFDVFIPIDYSSDFPPSFGGSEFNPQPIITIYYPDGIDDIYGDVKDVADAIYLLLEKGYPRDKIRLVTPPLVGMAEAH